MADKKIRCRVTRYFYYWGKDYYKGDIIEVDSEFYERWKAYLQKLKPEKVKPLDVKEKADAKIGEEKPTGGK
mgnify:CR=1 FL=1